MYKYCVIMISFLLFEMFLLKMIGDIHSRITPETEKVLIIEVEKELDIFLLHLENVDIKTAAVIAEKEKINKTVKRYNAALKRIRANLEQRWLVMASLLDAQSELLEMVENEDIRTVLSMDHVELVLGTELPGGAHQIPYFLSTCFGKEVPKEQETA